MHQVATSLEGIFDDPKLVADVKEAVATIKKVRLIFFGIQKSTASSFSTKNGLLWLPWYEEKCWKLNHEAMVQIGELSVNSSSVFRNKRKDNLKLGGFIEANMTPLAINQMTRWVNTKENFRMNIIEGVIRQILQSYWYLLKVELVVELFPTQEEHAGKIVSLM